MQQTWEEFKNFAMKGNVIDLAIGVIIGAAFTPIVATLVANIIMPVLGFVTAGVDFSNLAVHPVESVEIKYGLFLNAIVQFLITAVALFFLIKGINPQAGPGCPSRAKPVGDLLEGDPRRPGQRQGLRTAARRRAPALFAGARPVPCGRARA
jgi:large conductance mechanosensitive channel